MPLNSMLNESGLRKRAALIQAIRLFFINREYIEVDTPLRLPVLIPEAHIEALDSDSHFLQTSPEICMKRLLSEAGCRKIFQICSCFRGQERGDRHLPEFTMLEWYRAHCDYRSIMDECEDLIAAINQATGQGDFITVSDSTINLEKPWERLTVAEAFSQFAPVSMTRALAENTFDEILTSYIEPHLGIKKPVFLYDYPAEKGALARSKKEDPALAERFEIYIAGLELANGFSELTDQLEQQKRFEAELQLTSKLGRTPGKLPRKFLASLANMPEASGIALGIDRLAMVLWDKSCIDQVVSFSPEDL